MPITYPEGVSEADLRGLDGAEALFSGATTVELLQRHQGRKNAAGLDVWLERHRARHQVFADMLEDRYVEAYGRPKAGVALEIGCGIGNGVLPLAKRFDHVVGIDINARALVVAKKLLEEHGVKNVTLLQASAHELPFLDGTFDYIKAVNVVEHVYRPEHFFEEVHRVLAPGGGFAGDSRNRFDPFFPEPHVNLMWVGFLPRRLMEPYVRLRTGKGYDGKYLLSEPQLRRSVERSFGQECRIVLPTLHPYVKKIPNAVHRLLEEVHHRPWMERASLPLFPTHVAVARRS